MKQLVVIVGAGGVLGAAQARAFVSAGHAVVGVQRSTAGAVDGVPTYACDAADASALDRALQDIAARHGEAGVLIYNPAQFVRQPFLETAPETWEAVWRVSVLGAATAARAVLPAMQRAGKGCLLFTGATASVRGGAGFSAFASAKFALRGLAQSLARECQPLGIHVAHVVLDGLLAGSANARRFGTPGGPTLDPEAVAAAYRQLAGQPPGAWTQELDLRPQGERF